MSRLDNDHAYCDKCGRETHWSLARNGQYLVCQGCKDRFPCRSVNCGHFDCADARERTRDGKKALCDAQRAAGVALARELGVKETGAIKFVQANWHRVYPRTSTMETSSSARAQELISMARAALSTRK